MSKFKIGDSVEVTEPYQGMGLVGAKATIVNIANGRLGIDIKGWSGGHTCDVLPKGTRSGWWVSPHVCKKISTFKGNK